MILGVLAGEFLRDDMPMGDWGAFSFCLDYEFIIESNLSLSFSLSLSLYILSRLFTNIQIYNYK